jgi:hypothetical protein
MPNNPDFETAVETLILTKLIQKIAFLHFKFYDKNPYPHDHIFDHKTHQLKDHDCYDRMNTQQQLIKQPITY